MNLPLCVKVEKNQMQDIFFTVNVCKVNTFNTDENKI